MQHESALKGASYQDGFFVYDFNERIPIDFTDTYIEKKILRTKKKPNWLKQKWRRTKKKWIGKLNDTQHELESIAYMVRYGMEWNGTKCIAIDWAIKSSQIQYSNKKN